MTIDISPAVSDEAGGGEESEVQAYADGTPVVPATAGTGEEGADQGQPADDQGSAAAATADEAQGLLSDIEFEQLKGDPVALRKRINELHQEGLSKYTTRDGDLSFVDQLRADPAGTIRELIGLAQKRGYDIGQPAAADVAAEPSINDALVEAIGEDAAKLASPAIQRMISEALQEAIGPLNAHVTNQQGQVAIQRATDAVKQLEKAYPDWKKFEPEMKSLATKFVPGEGLTEFEWLENMYIMASHKGKTGDTVRDTLNRVADSARHAETPPRGVGPTNVADTGGKSIKDLPLDQAIQVAFNAALQGKRL